MSVMVVVSQLRGRVNRGVGGWILILICVENGMCEVRKTDSATH